MFSISEDNAITLVRGDSFFCSVGMTKNGQPYTPEEGDVIRFALKHRRMAPGGGEYADKEPLILKVIPNETLILHLRPEDTRDLPFGAYEYDLELTDANGEKDTFVEASPFVLTKDVD